MSEARTDTTQPRPHGPSAAQAAAGPGKHRGQAASEDRQAPAQGRHRRPAQDPRT
ncbi:MULTISPECIES: hypothetical protein [unclassified Streptomyces]|uniref:hypothetical protein n=1 Tax=unclassified Streptomyces TaxID=2593676 RepID=UPI003FD38C17